MLREPGLGVVELPKHRQHRVGCIILFLIVLLEEDETHDLRHPDLAV